MNVDEEFFSITRTLQEDQQFTRDVKQATGRKRPVAPLVAAIVGVFLMVVVAPLLPAGMPMTLAVALGSCALGWAMVAPLLASVKSVPGPPRE